MRLERKIDDEGNFLTINVTDEGVIFDVWDPSGVHCIATEARTFAEWADFVAEQDGARWRAAR